MKLDTEFQCRSYSAMVSLTTIVFVRYILLERIRRNKNDECSYGELFYMFCKNIRDMDLANALHGLMTLFADTVQTFGTKITKMAKNQVTDWMTSQAGVIQERFRNLCRKC